MKDARIDELARRIGRRVFLQPYSSEDDPAIECHLWVTDAQPSEIVAVEDAVLQLALDLWPDESFPCFISVVGPNVVLPAAARPFELQQKRVIPAPADIVRVFVSFEANTLEVVTPDMFLRIEADVEPHPASQRLPRTSATKLTYRASGPRLSPNFAARDVGAP